MRRIKRRTRWGTAGLVLGLIALLLVLGGTAYGKQTGAKFYNTWDYRTGDSNVDFGNAGVGQLACLGSPNSEGNAAFVLNFSVPDGASITKVTAYYYDTDPAEQLRFQMSFSEPGVSDALDGFTDVTSVDGNPAAGPPGGPQSVELIPTAPVAVDNANRRYFLYAEFSACGTMNSGPEGEFPSLLLDGVRVEYTE